MPFPNGPLADFAAYLERRAKLHASLERVGAKELDAIIEKATEDSQGYWTGQEDAILTLRLALTLREKSNHVD